MAANVDLMKGAYEAFAQGDADSTLDAFHDDVVWQGPNSTELPGGGEHSGKDEVRAVLGSVGSAWDEFSITPDEFFEEGDSVVVLLHADVKKGDQSAQLPTVHIARFEDGKIKRFQVLSDTLHSAQMLGLVGEEPPEEQ